MHLKISVSLHASAEPEGCRRLLICCEAVGKRPNTLPYNSLIVATSLTDSPHLSMTDVPSQDSSLLS